MKAVFVYPGCFTPPTYGHFRIVERAAEIFPELVIVCSTNKEKNKTRWYSEEECRDMWQHYSLPQNVLVKTFAEYAQEDKDFKNMVMVRGVRDENDLENEKRVMKMNKEKYGIDKLFYILAEEEFVNISASRVRKAAQEFDFQTLAKCVPPAIITQLLERALRAKNIFMVVGQPGSGKSTFLKMLADLDKANIHINTDLFSRAIKPLILEKFGANTDLVELAIKCDQELTQFIAPIWFHLLGESMKTIPADANVFLEIPYGLKTGKELYQYVGHKVLYIGCEDVTENQKRITKRGDYHHARFIAEIPNRSQSIAIAKQQRLALFIVDSSGSLAELKQQVENFLRNLKKCEENYYAKNFSGHLPADWELKHVRPSL